MQYNEKIKQIREDNDETQTELAFYLGTSQKQYGRWETEKNKMPIYILKKICEHYQVSADYILGLPNNYARTREDLANRKDGK